MNGRPEAIALETDPALRVLITTAVCVGLLAVLSITAAVLSL